MVFAGLDPVGTNALKQQKGLGRVEVVSSTGKFQYLMLYHEGLTSFDESSTGNSRNEGMRPTPG